MEWGSPAQYWWMLLALCALNICTQRKHQKLESERWSESSSHHLFGFSVLPPPHPAPFFLHVFLWINPCWVKNNYKTFKHLKLICPKINADNFQLKSIKPMWSNYVNFIFIYNSPYYNHRTVPEAPDCINIGPNLEPPINKQETFHLTTKSEL